MTIPQWITDSVAEWRQTLLLQEWEIRTGFMNSEESNEAKTASTRAFVETHNDSRVATINFSSELPDIYDYDWETTVVHELLHVRIATLIDYLYNHVIPQSFAPPVGLLLGGMITHLVEPIVESLSQSFMMVKYREEK